MDENEKQYMFLQDANSSMFHEIAELQRKVERFALACVKLISDGQPTEGAFSRVQQCLKWSGYAVDDLNEARQQTDLMLSEVQTELQERGGLT